MLSDYPINSRVIVRITGAIPPGLLGCIDDGQKVIIRNSEIAWGDPDLKEAYLEQTYEAVVIGYNPAYDELELSLRLTERDPWEKVPDKYPTGSQVDGQVIGLTEKGAFIELEAGVEGFLPVSQLPLDGVQHIEDWLWIEDRVKAVITRISVSRRRLGLSIRDLVAQRDACMQRRLWSSFEATSPEKATLAELLPNEVRLQLLRLGSDKDTGEGPRLRALIIEDDEGYAAGLESLLRRNGCQVTWVGDGVSGLRAVHDQEADFDLILLDWNLPGPKGHQLVRRLQQESGSSYLAMVLEPTSLLEQPEILERLRQSGVDLFSKADGDGLRDGLFAILQELRLNGTGHRVARPRHMREIPFHPCEEAASSPVPVTTLILPGQRESLQSIVSQLARNTGADAVMLLRLDPGRRCPVMEASAGRPFPLEEAPPDLIHSPLKDILQNGQEVYETVAPDSAQFKRLLDLRPFQGFLGVPLPSVAGAHYGLVLLRDQGGIDHQGCLQVRLVAYVISHILQERRLNQALLPWQAQNLVGRLVSSAIHEINNKLGAIQFLAEGLHDGLEELARWPEKAMDAGFLRGLEQAVERIAVVQTEAGQLRDQYLNLTARDDAQQTDLVDLANQMVRVLHAEAQRYNVVLSVKATKNLPPVHARPSQLRQILLNLILNAIQHMAELRRYASLVIDLSYLSHKVLPIEVRFIDEGPGIHRQLWERVFDFGFTTKTGGAGLGLTISRQVAVSLGGSLRVEESHMLWGTTFLLELPEAS